MELKWSPKEGWSLVRSSCSWKYRVEGFRKRGLRKKGWSLISMVFISEAVVLFLVYSSQTLWLSEARTTLDKVIMLFSTLVRKVLFQAMCLSCRTFVLHNPWLWLSMYSTTCLLQRAFVCQFVFQIHSLGCPCIIQCICRIFVGSPQPPPLLVAAVSFLVFGCNVWHVAVYVSIVTQTSVYSIHWSAHRVLLTGSKPF